MNMAKFGNFKIGDVVQYTNAEDGLLSELKGLICTIKNIGDLAIHLNMQIKNFQ